jgi:hypothetical protein
MLSGFVCIKRVANGVTGGNWAAVSDSGFLASYLIFSTPGCWEVTAQIGDREDSKITFVTLVEKIGDGPAWRR